MWFDPEKALSEIEGRPLATIATWKPDARPVSQLSQESQHPEPHNLALGVAEVAVLWQRNPGFLSRYASDDTLDHFEEKAAIREHDGGQPRAEAKTAALAEVASAAGVTSGTLRRLWSKHPDAVAYLAHLSACGAKTCEEAATALHWSRERAWQAEARLRAAGMVQLDARGRAAVRRKDAFR